MEVYFHNQLNYIGKNGAGERSRTPDRLITNQLLYQLSYASHAKARILVKLIAACNYPTLALGAGQSRSCKRNCG